MKDWNIEYNSLWCFASILGIDSVDCHIPEWGLTVAVSTLLYLGSLKGPNEKLLAEKMMPWWKRIIMCKLNLKKCEKDNKEDIAVAYLVWTVKSITWLVEDHENVVRFGWVRGSSPCGSICGQMCKCALVAEGLRCTPRILQCLSGIWLGIFVLCHLNSFPPLRFLVCLFWKLHNKQRMAMKQTKTLTLLQIGGCWANNLVIGVCIGLVLRFKPAAH